VQQIAKIRVLGQFDLSLGGVRVPPLESACAERAAEPRST
jgi:hypothetical protein